jgi:hypothetical protein
VVAVSFGRPRFDVGRLIMVPAFAAIVAEDVVSLDHGAHAGAAGVVRSAGIVLVFAFYAFPGVLMRRLDVKCRQGSTPHSG